MLKDEEVVFEGSFLEDGKGFSRCSLEFLETHARVLMSIDWVYWFDRSIRCPVQGSDLSHHESEKQSGARDAKSWMKELEISYRQNEMSIPINRHGGFPFLRCRRHGSFHHGLSLVRVIRTWGASITGF